MAKGKTNISITELRIGNLMYGNFLHKKEIVTVKSVNANGFCYDGLNVHKQVYEASCDYRKLKPIKLTEKLLVRLGWVKSKEKGRYGYIYKISPCDYNFIIERDFNKHVSHFFGHEFTDCHDPKDDYKPINIAFDIRYVHQLQNLYFFLTGKELILKN